MDEQRDERIIAAGNNNEEAVQDDPLARIAGVEPPVDAAADGVGSAAMSEEVPGDADGSAAESASPAESGVTGISAQRRPGLLERLRAWLPGSAGKRAELLNLTDAIASFPNAPSNYVLRGELYLQLGYIAEAKADFERAMTISEREFESADWGILPQVLRDRAAAGLETIQRSA